MAGTTPSISRYKNVAVLTGSLTTKSGIGPQYYSTLDFPTQNQLNNVKTFQIVISDFDRLDNLAEKYLGNRTILVDHCRNERNRLGFFFYRRSNFTNSD